MFNKIKSFFKMPAVTSNPSKDNFVYIDDFDLDGEDPYSDFSNEVRQDLENSLMKAFKDLEAGAKYMEFGHRKIGFKRAWDETGEKGVLELFDLKYPAAPGNDVTIDQFPERASVVLHFSGTKGLEVLIDRLEELREEMIAEKYKYIENELTSTEE